MGVMVELVKTDAGDVELVVEAAFCAFVVLGAFTLVVAGAFCTVVEVACAVVVDFWAAVVCAGVDPQVTPETLSYGIVIVDIPWPILSLPVLLIGNVDHNSTLRFPLEKFLSGLARFDLKVSYCPTRPSVANNEVKEEDS